MIGEISKQINLVSEETWNNREVYFFDSSKLDGGDFAIIVRDLKEKQK